MLQLKKIITEKKRESFLEGQENTLSGYLNLFQLWVPNSEDAVPGSLLVRDLGCLVPPEAQPPEKWSFLSWSVPHIQDICRFPRPGPCSDDQWAPHLHTHTHTHTHARKDVAFPVAFPGLFPNSMEAVLEIKQALAEQMLRGSS